MLSKSFIPQEFQNEFKCLPKFYEPALMDEEIFNILWQMTVDLYLKNSLPRAFKERLLAYIFQLLPGRYCFIRHLLRLWNLNETIENGEQIRLLLSYPPSLAGSATNERLLRLGDAILSRWPENNPELDDDILHCCFHIAMKGPKRGECFQELRRLLPLHDFHSVLKILSFANICADWQQAHPEIDINADEFVRQELHEFMLQNPWFVQMYPEFSQILGS